MSTKQKTAFADRKMLGRAIKDSFVKLSPKTQAKNPVMFLVFVAAILTSILWVVSLFGLKDAPSGYTLAIAVILWFTVLFANFAEAIAEGRGKAQADSLRASRKDVDAHKIPSVSEKDSVTVVPSAQLKKGELVIVKAGEQIPADGEVVEGAASVDESAITGESAPVIREAGGDRSAVTGGTTVLSDWIVVRVTNEAGESFLDKMIAMVEGAARKKTPNEIALQIFLVALSIIFILVTVSLYTYSIFSAKLAGIENPTSVTTLVALLVCLAPTTIGALLSAIGIAGMSRLNQANVLAMSGRAIEAAGDVDIEDTKKWVLSPERKAPQATREYAAHRLDTVLDKFLKTMQTTAARLQEKLLKPEVRQKGKEQVKEKARDSVLQLLSRLQAEQAQRNPSVLSTAEKSENRFQ